MSQNDKEGCFYLSALVVAGIVVALATPWVFNLFDKYATWVREFLK